MIFTPEETETLRQLNFEIDTIATSRDRHGWSKVRRPQNEAEAEVMFNEDRFIGEMQTKRQAIVDEALRRSPMWLTYAEMRRVKMAE